MLITLKDLLERAQKHNIAYGSFNAPNYESALAVIQAGQELNLPVILSPGPAHECFMPLEYSMEIYKMLAKAATVDVCIHLDHCDDLSYIKKALDLGATSVMYDGSHDSYENNVKYSQEVVAMAKPYGASVEAELGKVATSAIGQPESHVTDEYEYTDPDQAVDFVNRTKIDALAIAIGTVHGFYIKEPVLELDRVKVIKEKVKMPLVMHGGSGVSDADVKIAIANGINKINYYTYMAMDGGQAVKEYCQDKDRVFFHDMAMVAIEAMKADCKRAMQLFSIR